MDNIYGARWQTIKELVDGKQADTFLVKDINDQGDTHYVLKGLKSPKRIGRFKEEIKAVQSLSHENIVRLIDFDLESDRPYIVTEYCSGKSLSRAKPFWQGKPVKALKLFKQICEGVAYAHTNGTCQSLIGSNDRP